ncbi:MAG: cytochrome P450 [Sciscionella sp.]|nr:cytochrome P450 [Sciscionella sp.]
MRRKEVRMAMQLGIGRTVVRGLALAGDPIAAVFGLHQLPDPYPTYERIRARGELIKSKALRAYGSVSYPVANTVLRDPRFGVVSAHEVTGIDWYLEPGDEDLVHPVEHSLLALNPPRHTRLRRLASPWFTPRALRDRVPSIERVVADALDAAADSDSFDLVEDFAMVVPIRVICDLLGVPYAEHERFSRWGGVLAGALDGPRTMAERRVIRDVLAEGTAFFDQLIARRRVDPGDDLVSHLAQAGRQHGADGEPVDAHDINALSGLLLGAGFETTVNLIGNAVLALLAHPEQKRLFLDDPGLAESVVEEALRYDPPVQFTGRIAREDVTLDGRDLPAGSFVALLLGGANRDPRVFANPQTFDITRTDAREHLAFSSGIHYCLGAGLARLEAQIALRELFARFPDLRLAGGMQRRRTRNIRGPRHLPVSTSAARRSVAV